MYFLGFGHIYATESHNNKKKIEPQTQDPCIIMDDYGEDDVYLD